MNDLVVDDLSILLIISRKGNCDPVFEELRDSANSF